MLHWPVIVREGIKSLHALLSTGFPVDTGAYLAKVTIYSGDKAIPSYLGASPTELNKIHF